MILVVWKYAQMHQNTVFTTPDIKKKIFKDLILVVWKCIKTHFKPLQTFKKKLFRDMILVVWKKAQMH
jgi:hypothetical protein